MKTNRPYYHWLDVLKTASIFGVVYIHANSSARLALSTVYFRFGVPIFIISSFFLAEQHALSQEKPLSIISYFKKRIFRLFIPYFIWSIVYCWIKHRDNYPTPYSFFTVHWTGFGWSGQYFLLVLIQLTLIYPFLNKIRITKSILLLIATVTLGLIYLPFNYLHLSPFLEKISESLFIYWFFYIAFAIYIARHYRQAKHFVQTLNKYSRICFILCLPFIMVLEQIVIVTINPEVNPYFCLSTLLVSPLLFILMIDLDTLFPVFRKKIGNSSLYQSISSWSLGIFCLNPLMIIGLRSFYSAPILPFDFGNLAWLLAETLFIILVSILTSLFLEQIGTSILVK